MSGMKHPEWNARRGPRDNARRELPSLVFSYLAYVRAELAKDPEPPKLHPLRLATKRLRYTLELFRQCYGRGLEQRIDALRELQQRLGDTNDCVAAWELLAEAMPSSPQRDRMQKFLDRRAKKEAKKFRESWQRLFEEPGREAWWTGYLARPMLRRRGARGKAA